MTFATRSAALSRGPGLWWLVAGALTLVAVGCVTLGLQGHRHPLAAPVAAPTTRPTTPAPTTVAPPPLVASSDPVSLSIPAISVSVPLSALGLNFDGSVQVPTNDIEPGWFKLGPPPGQIGSSVILGHVDNTQGPGVFFQLRALQPGNQIHVTLADGAVTTFAVTSVVQYTKTLFPAQQVYRSQGTRALNLVTCGGAFDPQTGHYMSNIVVYSAFVSATAATAAPTPSPTTTPITAWAPAAPDAAVSI